MLVKNRRSLYIKYTLMSHAYISDTEGNSKYIMNTITNTIHVSKDGNHDFTTISDALASLPPGDAQGTCIFIHKGVYKEQLTIQTPYLTLVGEDTKETVLTFDLYARMPSPDIGKLGTFRTYSCLLDTHDFTAKNLTFENSSGTGPQVGQALAVYADGDRLLFEDCRFLGSQDTLFTAPLPPKEIEPNGFIGPKQQAARVHGRHCYRRCYIEGDIDFIFGGATAYFEDCEFFSKYINRGINGYVTAASTPEGQEYGYVMKSCHFTGNCPPHSVYLGRPWREFARTVLIDCEINEHIFPEGWNDWNKPGAHQTAFYAEYGSYGPGGNLSKRPAWIKRLTGSDLSRFTKDQVLAGNDNWNP